MYICHFSVYSVGFEDRNLILIVHVPGHWIFLMLDLEASVIIPFKLLATI